jgi:putative aminopeptidase FrvX
MTDLRAFLKQLISAPGLSGFEAPVLELIEDAWEPLTDEMSHSRLGSLHGLRRGGGQEPRPRVLLAAHMDAVGFMVSGIIEGFLRLAPIGLLDNRILPGQLVTVHGREDLKGVIVQPPAHLLPAEVDNVPPPLELLLVDVGLQHNQLKRLVRVGDPVSFAQAPIEMDDEFLVGHSLDNRASVAALTHCLQVLQDRPLIWDLWAVATVQEEESMAGAVTSAFQIGPQIAVAIDVTYGSDYVSPGHKTYPIGGGPTLGWGVNVHPGIYEAFDKLASRLEIPARMEVMPDSSGTDADGMQTTAQGIPTMVVSIPLRYMHTPVEMVSMKDILMTGRLLAEFVAQLDDDFMSKLSWGA